MAIVYRRVNGKEIQKFIAITEPVQAELAIQAGVIAVKAEKLLEEHRETGNAKIIVERGDKVDYYVSLVDEAALSIEFGREGFIDPDSGIIYDRMEPLYILSRASGVGRKRPFRDPKKKKLSKRALRDLLRKRKELDFGRDLT